MTPKPVTKKKAMVQLVHIFYILLDIFSYTYKHFIFQKQDNLVCNYFLSPFNVICESLYGKRSVNVNLETYIELSYNVLCI